MKTSLCSAWEFSPTWSEAFLGFETEAQTVELPHNPVEIPLHYADSESYQMVCGYRRILRIPGDVKNKAVFLRFDGAAHIATLYVNHTEVYTHRCGYTAFEVDISKWVQPGENQIAVRLDTTEDPSIPPFGFVVDYLTYGGLYREAWLITRPKKHISDIFVHTPTVDTMEISVSVSGRYGGEYMLSVYDNAGEKKWEARSKKGKAVSPHLPVRPWTPEEPVLYTLQVRLVSGDRIEDSRTVRFGFRTARFREDGFYLNGERYFLRGLNRHQCYPYIGYAATASLQQEDARILKEELGCNAVRTSHYPQSQHFIDACDELGLLVFTEIPGWQHIGDSLWKEQACRNVEEMILQYRNHPSIILWGVRINESVDDDAFYRQTNKLAHKLDPSRQTSGVRYLEKSRLLEDVYAFNDFSHTGGNAGCRSKKQVSPNPQKGFLISEHTGHMFPTKVWDSWEKRQEHAMRHMRTLNAAYADGEHAGCFGWCMFDYPTHKDFGSGDRVCYHGVMDAFRNPKSAAYAYASQGTEGHVLEVASGMDIGDYPGGQIREVMVFSNAEEVALYKNGVFVTKLHHTSETALPHPPFVVDDTIGNLLETQEGFAPAKAALIHDCLNAAAKYGMNALPITYRFKFAWCMLRYHVTMKEAVSLYGKYVGNWGGESTQWRFDAIEHGKCVKTVTRSASARLHSAISVSSYDLLIADTYDMASIRIRILNEWDCVASYAQLPVSLEASGAVTLVGPSMVCTEGGMCGCYVRTNEQAGEGMLKVSIAGMEPSVILFHAERLTMDTVEEPATLSDLEKKAQVIESTDPEPIEESADAGNIPFEGDRNAQEKEDSSDTDLMPLT